MDCWTSRFSLWAAKPLAPSLATQVPLSVSKARTLSSGGDFDSVSAPGVAVLGIDIACGLQGLRTAAIDPQKLSYKSVSARGDAEQPNPVSRSFALWDLHRCYQSRSHKKKPFERA